MATQTIPDSGILPISAADIDAATNRLQGVALVTPLLRSHRLSDTSGADVWLKREDLQPVRSYKIRGAYNFIAQLTPEQFQAGVVCASAGNHGQGVALACATLGVRGSVSCRPLHPGRSGNESSPWVVTRSSWWCGR